MTQVFRKNFLKAWKSDLQDQWLKGNFQSSKPDETQIANSQALAQAQLLETLSELDYEQFYNTVAADEDD